MSRALLACAFVVALAAGTAGAAGADGGETEVRARVTCSRGATAALRVRAETGVLRVDLELEHRRRAGAWLVVVLHERRIVARATLPGPRAQGDLELHRRVPDWFGTDTISIRASGPGGETCRASATL